MWPNHATRSKTGAHRPNLWHFICKYPSRTLCTDGIIFIRNQTWHVILFQLHWSGMSRRLTLLCARCPWVCQAIGNERCLPSTMTTELQISTRTCFLVLSVWTNFCIKHQQEFWMYLTKLLFNYVLFESLLCLIYCSFYCLLVRTCSSRSVIVTSGSMFYFCVHVGLYFKLVA